MTDDLKGRLKVSASIVAGLLLLSWLIPYWWLLSQDNPLQAPIVDMPFWPVACTTRGCITSATWERSHTVQTSFAHSTESDIPTPTESLTTAVRQRLVRSAHLRVPVTVGDARRYRESVLRSTNEESVREVLGMGLDEYDRLVILPLLQQEALRQERGFESFDDLFVVLAQEQIVRVPLRDFSWNPEKAAVER